MGHAWLYSTGRHRPWPSPDRSSTSSVGRSTWWRSTTEAWATPRRRALTPWPTAPPTRSAVLDAVGWDTARVLGVSFGGMVAQEVAATAPNGWSAWPCSAPRPAAPAGRRTRCRTWRACPQKNGWPSDGRSSTPASTPAGCRRIPPTGHWRRPWTVERPRTTRRARWPKPRQLEARRHHDVWDRLGRITCPTFVGSGRYDGIAPPANGAALASRSPGAVFRTYEGGHAFFAQDPASIPEITAFLLGDGRLEQDVADPSGRHGR